MMPGSRTPDNGQLVTLRKKRPGIQLVEPKSDSPKTMVKGKSERGQVSSAAEGRKDAKPAMYKISRRRPGTRQTSRSPCERSSQHGSSGN